MSRDINFFFFPFFFATILKVKPIQGMSALPDTIMCTNYSCPIYAYLHKQMSCNTLSWLVVKQKYICCEVWLREEALLRLLGSSFYCRQEAQSRQVHNMLHDALCSIQVDYSDVSATRPVSIFSYSEPGLRLPPSSSACYLWRQKLNFSSVVCLFVCVLVYFELKQNDEFFNHSIPCIAPSLTTQYLA